jgi:glycosyltransferase involved in cell wall biosynthesis
MEPPDRSCSKEALTMSKELPLVSVLTPVYNGEKYLAECIESVLAQTYQNWEYVIVNNCSTDKTLEIAQNYVNKDNRIRVVSNRHFVNIIENHNIAFSLISSQSKYCKVVSADDWIYPECITKLVRLAEDHPAIGIIGSYQNRANGVRWLGFPHHISVFSGREVCRLFLLGVIDFFGTPSAVLYRSALVRSEQMFFPGSNASADVLACLNSLQSNDFGFVHQILSFERVHDKAVSAKLRGLNSFLIDRIESVLRYGSIYLSHEECEKRLEELLRTYYAYLAVGMVNFKNREFWHFHKNRMKEIGLELDYSRLVKSTLGKLLDLLFNPKQTIEKMVRRLKSNPNKTIR